MDGEQNLMVGSRENTKKPTPTAYIVWVATWRRLPPAGKSSVAYSRFSNRTVSTSHLGFDIARQRRTQTDFRAPRRHENEVFHQISNFPKFSLTRSDLGVARSSIKQIFGELRFGTAFPHIKI